MTEPTQAPITISGVSVTGNDVAAVLKENPAFAAAVRMKALERRIAELEAAHAACNGQRQEAEVPAGIGGPE